MCKDVSLQQALEAYRVHHCPSRESWKNHYVNETFSNDNILKCTENEQEHYRARVTEGRITICQNIRQQTGKICTLAELLRIVRADENKDIKKLNRAVVFSTSNGERPNGKKAFTLWNGFQVIDMDIKDRDIALAFKEKLFERLKQYCWFLGVTLSSSGKGLHIYTKIQVPESEGDNYNRRKIMYLTNFRHKFSFVYLACLKFIDELGVTTEQLLKWMDLAMFKPQQGAFIGYDHDPYINAHFFEDFIYVDFDNVEDMGHPDVDWVTYPDLREAFKRWEWFEEETEDQTVNIEVKEAEDLDVDMHNKVHYKHFERWRLANTLVKIYGLEKGYKYLRMICSNQISDKELQSDCTTASRHDKPIDVWAVNRLNSQHGFHIKINVAQEETNVNQLYDSIENIDNPTIIRESPNTQTFYIKSNEYLGNVKQKLLDNLGRITLIEAGAGAGKTEMVKMLVREGKRILLVMPFTSTLKAKVENVEDWYVSYGNRKVRFDTPARGVGMTLDKFSRLNLMEVKDVGFDYIFIDESHLLFQSEYRPVMSKVIEKIRTSEVPIILMSGTPVAETVFFSDITHLKVIKEDTRKKSIHVNLVNGPDDLMYFMCRKMAKDISEGRRVLFPTNRGTLYKEQLESGVRWFLENEFCIFEPPVVNYYKKSNLGESFMDDVNIKKTIAQTDILLCSNYLSVGVDILDKFVFSIYFNELWMPQEMEQFANRLRSNDLYINLFVAKTDADGNSLGISQYREMNLRFNEEELKNSKAIVRLCNAMIERNPIEYKYNSLIASIIYGNKFIEYNEIENKYYVNDIAYKTIYFERKYREYVEQLPVMIKGMMYYGYEYSSKDLSAEKPKLSEFKRSLSTAYDMATKRNTKHIEELLQIITEDRLPLYKSVLQGEYEIVKGNAWTENTLDRVMTVKNVEIFEKVVPLCVSLSKMFEVPAIRDIFEFCRNSSHDFNFAAIKRIKTLANIVFNNRHNRLDLPIVEFMNKTYDFVEEHPTVKRMQIVKFVNDFAMEYAEKESNDEVKIRLALLTMKTIQDTFMDIFKCLVTIGKPDKMRSCKLRRAELIWQERTTKNDNDNIFALAEFLDCMNPVVTEIEGSEATIVEI